MRSEVIDYLTSIPCWFLATVENGLPHVRPFSFAAIDGGRIVFCTATDKDVYRQLRGETSFELSGWKPGSGWIVVSGRAVLDADVSDETRKAGFIHMTGLGESYAGWDDPRLTFFALDDGAARIADIDGTERTVDLSR